MANEELASILESNIEYLTEVWMQRVRSDARINSDEVLSRSELRDHVPAILEDICELLKSDQIPDSTNTSEGRVKVYLRLLQGYRGSDLVRELSLLRILVFDFLTDRCSDSSTGVNLALYNSGARIINLYLDETLRNAISAYSEAVELPGLSGPQAE